MGSRILLADDSITIQKVVHLTFSDEGFDVVSVSNGDQAERMLGEVAPDLVLADIFMPGKNGYELCEAIKQSPQFHHVPVVLLVGAFEPFDQAEARRVRADAHLTKPFESRALVETVRSLLNASARPRTGPLPPLPPPETKHEPSSDTRPTTRFAPPAPTPRLEPEAPPLPIQAEASSFTLSETTPLDISIGAPEPSANPLPPEAQFLPIEMFEAEPEMPPSGPHSTDDLSFASANDAPPFQMLNFESVDLVSPPPITPTAPPDLAATFVTHDDHHDAQVSQFSFGEDMVLDFNPSDAPATPNAQASVSFALDAPEAFAVDMGEPLDGTGDGALDDEEENLQTTLLVAPPHITLNDDTIATNPFAMPAAAMASSPGAFELSSASDAVEASMLLEVDEPLGDVLEDESQNATLESMSPLEPSPEHAGSDVAFGYDITPQATATAHDMQSPPAEADALTSDAGLVFEPEAVDAAPSAEAPSGQSSNQSPAPFAAFQSPLEPRSTIALDERPIEWADSAPSDSVFDFAPPVAAEHAHPEDDEPSGAARNGKYPTSTMWSADDAHFTAIDIEATTVEETELASFAGEARTTEELTYAPFESEEDNPVIPSVEAYAESPAMSAPMDATDAATESRVAPEPSVAQAAASVELSPALIDEIVRRVVAQMSEAVIREIAWDIVPDVVERVIKEMTQSELVKRL
jgi:CheY-like chemotaxis protein